MYVFDVGFNQKSKEVKTMSKRKDQGLQGRRFGRLLAVQEMPRVSGSYINYTCLCDCGNEKLVKGYSLLSGTKSCGCLSVDVALRRRVAKRIDEGLTGQRFERLAVIREIPTKEPNPSRRQKYYLCKCDCGNEKEIRGYSLTSGAVRSCGCLQREAAAKVGKSGINIRHGACIGMRSDNYDQNPLKGTYESWHGMFPRCEDTNDAGYVNYGARGIKITDSWRDFSNFLKDMGLRPEGLSIERIDNDGNYEPENCRWATTKEQGRNKTNSRLITHGGMTKPISQWAEELNIKVSTLFNRFDRGWTVERALSQPVTSKGVGT